MEVGLLECVDVLERVVPKRDLLASLLHVLLLRMPHPFVWGWGIPFFLGTPPGIIGGEEGVWKGTTASQERGLPSNGNC